MDLRQIKNLMKEFEDSKIHKLEITDKDFSIKLEKEESPQIFSSKPIVEMAQPTPQLEVVAPTIEEEVNIYKEVKAPLVGTYYSAPSPESDPFVEVGTKVQKGDVLFIVEAMKVMNEITSPVSGVVRKINVSDATMVEFGQVVMEIEE